jgi:hypothetical protein
MDMIFCFREINGGLVALLKYVISQCFQIWMTDLWQDIYHIVILKRDVCAEYLIPLSNPSVSKHESPMLLWMQIWQSSSLIEFKIQIGFSAGLILNRDFSLLEGISKFLTIYIYSLYLNWIWSGMVVSFKIIYFLENDIQYKNVEKHNTTI